MSAKQFLLIAVFQATVFSLAFGQTIDLNSRLTKPQMYKDFDEFVQIIKDINIQGNVRENVTGYNPLTCIQQE